MNESAGKQPILVEKLVIALQRADEARNLSRALMSDINRIKSVPMVSPNAVGEKLCDRPDVVSSVSIEDRIDGLQPMLIDLIDNITYIRGRLNELV